MQTSSHDVPTTNRSRAVKITLCTSINAPKQLIRSYEKERRTVDPAQRIGEQTNGSEHKPSWMRSMRNRDKVPGLEAGRSPAAGISERSSIALSEEWERGIIRVRWSREQWLKRLACSEINLDKKANIGTGGYTCWPWKAHGAKLWARQGWQVLGDAHSFATVKSIVPRSIKICQVYLRWTGADLPEFSQAYLAQSLGPSGSVYR